MRVVYTTLILSLLTFMLLPGDARAAETSATAAAEAQLRATSQQVLDLLADPEAVAPGNTDALVDRLHNVLDERFDWEAMARWVLGRKRSSFDDRQTDTFAKLFSDYVVLYYLTQVEEYIAVGKPSEVDQVRMEFREARKRRDGAVAMEVVFVTPKGTDVETGYTLVQKKGTDEWRIRNFIVEGVSLVRNWRTQLTRLDSAEEIIGVMRDKVAELRQARTQRNKEVAE